MLKLTGIFLIILSAMGMGLCKSLELTEKMKILESLIRILSLLKGEIRCTGASLEDAFLSVADKMSGDYRAFFEQLVQSMKKKSGCSFGELFQECAMRELPIDRLSEEDKNCFLSFGGCLGYLDKKMQLGQLTLLEEEMTEKLVLLRKKAPEKKKVYRSLGILGGIFLAVLMW